MRIRKTPEEGTFAVTATVDEASELLTVGLDEALIKALESALAVARDAGQAAVVIIIED